MKRSTLICGLVLLIAAILGGWRATIRPAHAIDPTPPFEMVSQDVNGTSTLVRMYDGSTACYLLLSKGMPVGTVPPKVGVKFFTCLPVAAPAE